MLSLDWLSSISSELKGCPMAHVLRGQWIHGSPPFQFPLLFCLTASSPLLNTWPPPLLPPSELQHLLGVLPFSFSVFIFISSTSYFSDQLVLTLKRSVFIMQWTSLAYSAPLFHSSVPSSPISGERALHYMFLMELLIIVAQFHPTLTRSTWPHACAWKHSPLPLAVMNGPKVSTLC